MNQKQTTTAAADHAAYLAGVLPAQIETASGLVEALDILTLAGQTLDTDAKRHNLAVYHNAAGAVLDALRDRLETMQAQADKLDELATAILSPIRNAALFPTRETDSGADADQIGAGYTLENGEALADFARRAQRLSVDELDKLSSEPAGRGEQS